MMIIKKEAIRITNSYLDLKYNKSATKVKIPVYKKRWKLWLLDFVILIDKKIAKIRGGIVEFIDGVSSKDYSRIIFPDSWIFSHSGHIAIDLSESKYVYIMEICNPFLLENTRYGMRPLSAFDYSLFGQPSILIDKGSGELYDLGLSFNFDEIDFNNYKENKASKLNWNKYIKKIPQ